MFHWRFLVPNSACAAHREAESICRRAHSAAGTRERLLSHAAECAPRQVRSILPYAARAVLGTREHQESPCGGCSDLRKEEIVLFVQRTPPFSDVEDGGWEPGRVRRTQTMQETRALATQRRECCVMYFAGALLDWMY